jgi:glutamine synthetase
MTVRGMLTVEEIRDLIDGGQIDTVLMVFSDLQGRLMGKRLTGDYFVNDILEGEGAIHACSYLIANDMEMEPVPGYAYAGWQTGYGDLMAKPDLTTLRRIPWLEKTALVLCDAFDEVTREPVEFAPRQILRRQVERAAEAGHTIKTGSELEFYLFRDSFEEAAAKRYADLRPHSDYIMDYHVLQTTKDEYLIRQIRNGMDGAGVPVEFSKGEFGRGQHEINLRYADALEMADRHVLYKNGVKEIAALAGRAVTFMAKWSMAEAGSSFHLHSSVWDRDGSRSLMWETGAAHHMSAVFRGWLGGLMATAHEMAWMFAPFVNSYKRYQPGSWAPTAIAWGEDNRTCGFRVIGEHAGHRVESRIPGADANPYLAFAATIAGGLHGIENGIEPPPMFRGNAYEATDVPRVPMSLHAAVDAFAASKVARRAFGDAVFEHLLNCAVQEQAVFDNRCVTDWELARYFERG